jgi:hypothetical protein
VIAEGLVRDLDDSQRRVDRLLVRRWLNLALLAVLAMAAGYGVYRLTLPPNLAAAMKFRTSSSAPGCSIGGTCDALFHTNSQNNPWVEVDLGAQKAIKRIEVTNRGDCCQERAVPLVAEVSADATHWREVARQDKEFTTWTATFPRTVARYVRLRIPGLGMLHLKGIVVR